MDILPPLPDPLPPPDLIEHLHGDTPDNSLPQSKSIRDGAWIVTCQLLNAPNIIYDGTLRIKTEQVGKVKTASGDLYQRETGTSVSFGQLQSELGGRPDPTRGIPICSRRSYRYYIRITRIISRRGSVEIGLQMWSMNSTNRTWTNQGDYSAVMSWTSAPPGYPLSLDYLEGNLKSDMTNADAGQFGMGWVSNQLRKVIVEIDSVKDSDQPMESGNGHNWQSVFSTINWDLSVIQSKRDIPTRVDYRYSDAELHKMMLEHRAVVDLDQEWRFHILVVPFLASTSRGLMYDGNATDSNNVPREGVAMSSHWPFPEEGWPDWGRVKGRRFGSEKVPFFRTAIHELGHAFGLFHESNDNGFMTTSDTIAARGTPANPFPDNVKWAFSENAVHCLRHYPDIFVRPGGVPFGAASETSPPVAGSNDDSAVDGLRLEIVPLQTKIPLGAPIRVSVKLTNTGGSTVQVPHSLSLKSGFLRGAVTDASGDRRTFSPLIRCVDEQTLVGLNPEESITDDLVLMRGGQGALVPTAGDYGISVNVSWERDFKSFRISGDAIVSVTTPESKEDTIAAQSILASPDAHLVLVIGGEYLSKGIAALQEALRNSTLRPHYAAIEAKRLLKPESSRMANISKAAQLIREKHIIMCCQETKLLAEYFNDARNKCRPEEQEQTEVAQRVLQHYYHIKDV